MAERRTERDSETESEVFVGGMSQHGWLYD